MKQIEATVLRYIVPFLFRESLDRAVPKIERYEKGNSTDSWSWERVDAEDWKAGDCTLYDFIPDNLFSDTGDRMAEGRSYQMKKMQNRPFLATRFTAAKGDEETEVTVAVTEIGLLLTRNRVGFLWFELGLSNTDLTQELVSDFQQKLVDANPFAEWIAEWVSPLESVFFPGKEVNGKLLPGRPYLYSGVVFSKATEDKLRETAYVLATGRDHAKLGSALKEKTSAIFPGSITCCTEEGVAFAFKDKEYDLAKVRKEFFLLILYYLYRRYTILFFTERFHREVSAASEDYERLRERDAEKKDQKLKRREKCKASLERLRIDMALFLLKSDGMYHSWRQEESEFARFFADKFRLKEQEAEIEHRIHAVEILIGEIERVETEEESEKRQEEETEEKSRREQEEEQRGGSLFGRRKGKMI